MRFFDLDVQFDAVVEQDDLWCAPQLAEAQPAAWSLTPTQRPSDHHAFGGHSGSSTDGCGNERGAGQTCTTSRVHDSAPPRYRRAMRGPMRVTIS